jgi:hypothetical protein
VASQPCSTRCTTVPSSSGSARRATAVSLGPRSLAHQRAGRREGPTTQTLVTDHSTQRLTQFVVAEPPRQSLWDTTLQQLDEVARSIALDPGIHRILRRPERELTVSVPVMMDDGRSRCSMDTGSSIPVPGGRAKRACAITLALTLTRSGRLQP